VKARLFIPRAKLTQNPPTHSLIEQRRGRIPMTFFPPSQILRQEKRSRLNRLHVKAIQSS
jgi:hypothetical protein